jgi:acyl-coenzyme A thioesterase PaaI-like protein
MKSLQEQYSPQGICFGCGVANHKGLQLKSFPQQSTDQLVASWRAQEHHQAFPGMLNGGIIGALLDCHCNWTAAYFLMRAQGKSAPDCTVTAEYSIKLHQPTPIQADIQLRAWPTRIGSRSASIEGELWAGGQLCASCTGVFVSVKEGHPAYHQW